MARFTTFLIAFFYCNYIIFVKFASDTYNGVWMKSPGLQLVIKNTVIEFEGGTKLSEVKMLVDRLLVQQEETNVIISHEGHGFKIENHFVTSENIDCVEVLCFNENEKDIILKFLLEEEN